tara:strand:- start:1344 stop:2273 length:930 start_codon:yes stop_codon:yes gene_type:complete
MEGFTSVDYPTIIPVGSSSKYIEKVQSIKNNFVREINDVIEETSGQLKEDDLSDYIEHEILKAMILSEKENINNPELFNKDGSWKKGFYDTLVKINNEIDKEEEDALETEEEKEILRGLKSDIKNAEIQRWGKTINMMTKKEMDQIFKNELKSSSTSKLCIGKSLKDDNTCKKYDNDKNGCENKINSCIYIPMVDRKSLNQKLIYFRDKIKTLEEDRGELINENKGNQKISSLLDGGSFREQLRYLRELKNSDETLKGCTNPSQWNRNKKKICENIIKDIQTTIRKNEFSRRKSPQKTKSTYRNRYSSK